MNIYFLVEGKSTEAEVYPAWMSYLLPEFKRVNNYDEVEYNNYYLFTSNGIPSVYTHIINAIKDINSSGRYDYFVICIDSDAASISQREAKIFNLLEKEQISLKKASLQIIVQNRCIETWFLGNRKVYTRNPQKNPNFVKYSKFYNVSENDPELMKKPDDIKESIANFHVKYLKAMFNEKGEMSYSKSNSKIVQEQSYLIKLQNRIKAEPLHLGSFVNFLQFCSKIKDEVNK
jgi:hypothetical protein